MSKKVQITIAASILAAIIGAIYWFQGDTPQTSASTIESTSSQSSKEALSADDTTTGPEVTENIAQKVPDEKLVKMAAELERENEERVERFKADGWKEVDIEDVPDEKVMNLDPTLLGEREEEIQNQISSNSFSGEKLDRLAEIALKTESEKTRYLAIEALGRSHGSHTTDLLIDIYKKVSDEESKSQIIGAVLPSEPADRASSFLFEQVSDPSLSPSIRSQAAFPLAMLTLVKNNGIISPQFSGEGRIEIEKAMEILKRGKSSKQVNGGER